MYTLFLTLAYHLTVIYSANAITTYGIKKSWSFKKRLGYSILAWAIMTLVFGYLQIPS